MRKFFLLCLLTGFLSCENKKADKETNTADTSVAAPPTTNPPGVEMQKADPLMDTLLKIPFIMKSNNYIDSLTNHQHGISFLTDTLDQSYEIKAGYNGPERFETYHHLSVDKKTMEIKVLEPVEGEYIPLKDYLKNNQ